MKEDIDINKLKKQAVRFEMEYPDLFEYLVHRDNTTFDFVRSLIDVIPDPESFPEIVLPFADLIIEKLGPNPASECSMCQDDPDSFIQGKMRERLCEICKKGNYLRRSGLAGLSR
ncbi:MAG: hypothetical protein ACN4GR_17440 [Arenicellales bacterium]